MSWKELRGWIFWVLFVLLLVALNDGVTMNGRRVFSCDSHGIVIDTRGEQDAGAPDGG